MEPPTLPNLAALGIMCSACYPGAGDRTTLCDEHFRSINRSIQADADVDFSHAATVDTIARAVIPLLFQQPDMAQEMPQLATINPLHDGILLWGGAGRGKTYQASIATRRAIAFATQHGPALTIDFQWWSSAGLLERLRDRAKESAPLIEQLTTAKLLVVDDLGAEKPSEWVRERLYQIINTRYEAVRPVLVTTNLNPAQLEKQLGARITGRLSEMCRVFEIDGPNRRLAGAA